MIFIEIQIYKFDLNDEMGPIMIENNKLKYYINPYADMKDETIEKK